MSRGCSAQATSEVSVSPAVLDVVPVSFGAGQVVLATFLAFVNLPALGCGCAGGRYLPLAMTFLGGGRDRRHAGRSRVTSAAHFFFTGYRLESGDTILATSTTTEFRLDWTCEANLDILRAFSAAADFLAWKSVMWASAIRTLRRSPFDRYSPYSADAIS